MAKQKRIWRESQHPRDARGRFARRGGAAWVQRAAAELTSEAGASTRGEGGRPRIARNAKAGVVLQSHTDGGRPSAVRVPKATVTQRPSPANLADFNSQARAAVSAPAPKSGDRSPEALSAHAARLEAQAAQARSEGRMQDAWNADLRAERFRRSAAAAAGGEAPQKRTPRPAPGAAALIAARAAEQAPQMPAMVAARTAPETAPVPGAEAYAAMRRHTLVALARDAGVNIRGKSNTEIANDLAAHDAKVKASRAAKLNPSGVGTSSGGTAEPTSPELRKLQVRVEALTDRRDAARERRKSSGARVQSAAESKAEAQLEEARGQLREAKARVPGRIAAIEAELGELQAASAANFNRSVGGGSLRTKAMSQRVNGQLRQAGEIHAKEEKLKEELRELRGEPKPEAPKALPPKPETVHDRYGNMSRAEFDALPAARRQEIAADLRATSERHRGDQLNDGGAALLMGKFGVSRVDTPRANSQDGGMTSTTPNPFGNPGDPIPARDSGQAWNRAVSALRIVGPGGGPNNPMTPYVNRAPEVGDIVTAGGLNRKGVVVRAIRRNRTDGFDVQWDGEPYTRHQPGSSLSVVDMPEVIRRGRGEGGPKVEARTPTTNRKQIPADAKRAAIETANAKTTPGDAPKMQRIEPGRVAVPDTGPVVNERDSERLSNLVSNMPASLQKLGAQWADAMRSGDIREARRLAYDLNERLRTRDREGTAGIRTLVSNGTEAVVERVGARNMAAMLRRNTERFPGEEFRTITATEAMQLGFHNRTGGIDTPEMAHERLATLRRTGFIMPPGRRDGEDGVEDNPDFEAARQALAPKDATPQADAKRTLPKRKVKAPEAPAGNEMSAADLDSLMRSKGLDPSEFTPEQRRDWLKRYEVAFGPTKAPANNDASKTVADLKARIRSMELEREAATLYGDSSGGDEDEQDRAKKAQRQELADLKAKLLDAERAERGYDKTRSKAFVKLSDAALDRAIKEARPGTKRLQDLNDERDARAAERFKAARPKAEAAREAVPATGNLEKARAAATEKHVDILRHSKDPKDNSAKIKAIVDGRMGAVDLYRQAHAGPSGQRAPVHVGRVRHTPGNETGEYTVTAPGGERVGYVTSVVRNGDQQYAVYSDNGDGGTELLGWADTLAHAADVLTNGEAAASTGGTLDARRISGRLFERNPNRNKSIEELEREALNREIATVQKSLTNPNIGPQMRASAERRLARLEAERRGEPEAPVDTPRVKSQNGGMTQTPSLPSDGSAAIADAFNRNRYIGRTVEQVNAEHAATQMAKAEARRNAVIEHGTRFTGNPYSYLSKFEALTDEDFAALTDEQRDNVRFVVSKLAKRAEGEVSRSAQAMEKRFGKWGTSNTPTTEATARPGETTLGVTESSRGRTTTVTLPDGTTAQRTSKTMAYTHAVVATVDHRGEARDLRADNERRQKFIDALQAWVDRGADTSELVAHPTRNLSHAEAQRGKSRNEYYLPGFEPVRVTVPRTRHGGGGTRLEDTGYYSLPNFKDTEVFNYKYDDRGDNGKTAWEVYGPQYVLDYHRSTIETQAKRAAELDAGPAESHGVYRWSQSLENAWKGRAEFEQMRNTRLQVVGVGGVAKELPKSTKKVPTPEERAAALEAKKAAEKVDAAKRRQQFFDDKIKGVTEALNAPGRDDPEWHLRGTTEAALVALAKHLGAKVPRREKDGWGTAKPHDPAMLRKLIIDAVRARSAEGKA